MTERTGVERDGASSERELTVRERKFLDAKLEGASHAEAARQAGYGTPESTSKNLSPRRTELPQRPRVRQKMTHLLTIAW